MKNFIFFVAMIIGMIITTQGQDDSTYYFVSWISQNSRTFMTETITITVKNTVMKVPSIWTLEKVYTVAGKIDNSMLYMTYLTEVPEDTYTEFFRPDSLVSKQYKDNPMSANATKIKWNVEFAVLNASGDILSQGWSDFTVTSEKSGIHIQQLSNYIKEVGYTDPKIKIVITRFQKK